ncbi:MAG: hypothetical protein HUK25_01920 [Treponema sp.]|nr:hypothetical protein [Treponema sp.]
MKKIIIYAILIFSVLSLLNSQNSERRQILIPKTIFVGDTAELKIGFTASADYIKTDGVKNPSYCELTAQSFENILNDSEYTIKSLRLTKTGFSQKGGYTYELSIFFVPWKPGKLQIPPYNLSKEFSENTESGFLLVPDEITVESIFSQPNISRNFVPSKGPLLIPGTTYRILLVIILFLILLIILIRISIRWKRIALGIKNIKLKLRYKKNTKHTIKTLKQLLKSRADGKDFAAKIQSIMRSYLQVRFDYPFTKCVSSGIALGFQEIFGDLLSEKKENAVEELSGIFIRTDYVRYSKEGLFKSNEKSDIIESLIKIISVLENTKEEEK